MVNAPFDRIIHATAEDFAAGDDERFTAIVFNEMLYYVSDPIAVVRKYIGLLNADGLILCSIFHNGQRPSLRRSVRFVASPCSSTAVARRPRE